MSGEGIHNPLDGTEILADIATLQAAVDDLDADVVLLQADVDAIEAIIEAEAILEEAGGELTTDGTAQTIYINNAPAGVYRPICLIIDFANHTVTETVVLREYYRIAPGGPLTIADEHTFAGPVDNPLRKIDLSPTRYGIRIVMEKTVGTNRAYDWTVFYEV